MGLLALVVFWGLTTKLWILDGPRLPLIFIGLWFSARMGFNWLGISGFYFVSFEALLAVVLSLIMKCKTDA